jgi:hypothetical protein
MRRIQRDRLANQLAADIEEAMAHVDNLAMPGTYLHQQLISATLYGEPAEDQGANPCSTRQWGGHVLNHLRC